MDIQELIKQLESHDEAERIYAAQDIAETNNPDMAIPLFRRFQIENSPAVREAIVFSLKNMPCNEIYDQIFRLFGSSDAYMRNTALSVFASGGDDALGFLTLKMGNSDREVRKLILDALFAIGTFEAVLAIRAALHDPSVNVQITAVEYLGRLEDKDSTDDLISLFQKETEPMLRTAILDSLSMIGDKSSIIKALSILTPKESQEWVANIDPIYIPEVIRLAAQAGDTEYISKILDAVSSFKIYANDIIRAIDLARHRFKDSFREEPISEKLIAIAKDKEIPEDSRNAAVELLLEEGNQLSVISYQLSVDKLDDLGTELIAEESMKYAGVRLLAVSGKMSGYAKIKKIMEETKDEELRLLCEELLEVDKTS